MQASSFGKCFWKSGKVLGIKRLSPVLGIGDIPHSYSADHSAVCGFIIAKALLGVNRIGISHCFQFFRRASGNGLEVIPFEVSQPHQLRHVAEISH